MKIKVGDLVKHLRSRGNLTMGIVTAIRGNTEEEVYSCDVLWQSGRHSAHTTNWLWLLEAE